MPLSQIIRVQPCSVTLAALGLVICLACAPVRAADQIPIEIISATSSLTPGQHQVVDQYIARQTGLLTTGTDKQVAQARSQLIDPLIRGGATDSFTLAYSSAASNRLIEAVESDRLAVRINAMIITAHLSDLSTLGLVEKGLADPNPAVRYWAAKAASDTGSRDNLPSQEQAQILDLLVQSMVRESSEHVLQQLLMGLVGLSIPEASTQLLDVLNRRVAVHTADPGAPLGAALVGLRTLFVKTVEASSNDQLIGPDTLRQLTLVAYRYLALSATLLEQGLPAAGAQPAYRKMVELTCKVLPWSASQIAPDVLQPGPIQDELAQENWPEICLRVEEWKHLLASSAFGYDPADLALPPLPSH